ncbi:uncharacterized protein RMCC_5105 [Mycolicibacterium canariasense]|uniref:J domain-containing protein n=1 Tax=Mycolicibacterium canariasense TaxID=228230 RepID=A0A100WH88_MYCCR|nr:hypothetical protein [Mycolicibacterium canariasense]MCV7213000.1 hypothetical protein [Mycolicibacterium canariasense]GAS98140.1 uncharacterized protein RMCC_5105 [Mycolicibacterium canariasense]
MGQPARRSDAGDSARPAKKAAKKVAKKAPAKKAVKKAAGKKAPGKKAVGKKAPGKKAAGKKATSGNPRPPGGSTRSSTGDPAMGLPQLPEPPDDPRKVLGLGEVFTVADVRRAWRRYAARHHPDQGGDAATFTRGRLAYETLTRRTP